MGNHISGNAMFTEVPHDMTAHRGQDVEMACSFRGAGTPSYSLEIQWWYIRNHVDWMDRQPWTTNEVGQSPENSMPKDATKISVVKVVGSNISHKLRLSRVKPSDEGTYECRVIDFSDGEGPRHHRVRAYLQVAPESDISDHNSNFEALDHTKGGVALIDSGDGGHREHAQEHHRVHGHHQEHGKQSSPPAHHGHSNQQHKAGRELKKRELDTNYSHSDCTNEPSCTL
eukprot:XP_011620087.1 PREDICTED: V-set and transmembrane domain-containing protein 2-like protein [Takifugu rubripes]